MTQYTSHHTLPPFPEDWPVAPLVSCDFAKLEARDKPEEEALFQAGKALGFFYLDLTKSEHGQLLIQASEKLLILEREFFALPNEVKDEYGRDKIDPFFAYRVNLAGGIDDNGEPTRNESINLRKDDILGIRKRLPCHDLILESQEILREYILKCRTVVDIMIPILEQKLGLAEGALAELHRFDHPSGDHVRLIQAAPQTFDADRAKRAEHTDFGTITILFNWLGGLQIRHPETDEWTYVKPVPGSAVVNFGDAVVKFTSGILRSNVHRVVPSPPPQVGIPRNSLVYFTRPEDHVILKPLQSDLIKQQPKIDNPWLQEEMTSAEWVRRRGTGDLRGVFTLKGGLESRPHAWIK